jgi:erythromycin esterase-like protein
MKAYGHQVMPGGELAELAGTIQASLLSTLTELQRQNREAYALMLSPSELLNAEQCAQVVVNGESYFRELYTHTAVDTWNLRDQHFVQTALRLREYHTAASGAPPKMVFWAHNSHVGDARATELGSRRQEWNLGQMIRSTFGTNNTFVCGFGTHGGTVTAASEWGEEAKTFELNPAQKGSYSELFHRALPSVRSRVDVDADALNAFLLLLRSDAPDADERERAATAAFATNRRQRAIGVCYKKEQESLSHYFEANLSSQCDAWIHVDNTNALVPLAVP